MSNTDNVEKALKFIGIGIGVGIVIGVLLTLVIIRDFKANPTKISIGGVDFEFPTATALPTPVISPNSPSPVSTSVAIPIQSTPTKVFLEVAPIATLKSEKDGMVLVYVPEGEFIMGSNSGNPDERPAHSVYLNSFWIDQTEVTNRMYALCVASGACIPPSKNSSITRENYYNNFAYENYPVMFISWVQAKTYCEWAKRRLPSEAEWEKSARGTDGRNYPWGNDEPQEFLLNFNRFIGDTTDVYKYSLGTSPYGAFGMAGNVYEWVADFYDPNYYANNVYDNPTGPASANPINNVVRGGSWVDKENYTRSSARIYLWFKNADDPGIGFRCALSAK